MRLGSEEEIDHRHDECGRQHHADIKDELIAQAAALRLGGDDSGVTDEREVVSEESASDDSSRDERKSHLGLVRQSGGNGHECHYRTDGSAHAERGDAGGDEEPG